MNSDMDLLGSSKRSRWRWLRWLKWPFRVLSVLSVVFALSVLLLAGWVWSTNRRGEAALEEILKELGRRGLPTDTQYLKKQFDASGERENGARFYKAAFAALGADEAYDDDLPYVGLAAEPEPATQIDKELAAKMGAFLEKHRMFFSLLDTARRNPRCFYDLNFHTGQFEAVTLLDSVRKAARVLSVKSLNEQAHGRSAAALDACEAIADIDLSLRNDPSALVALIRVVNAVRLCRSLHCTLSRSQPNLEDLRRLRAKLILVLRSMSLEEMLKIEIAAAAMQAKDPHLHGAAEIYRVGQYQDMFRRYFMSEQQKRTSTEGEESEDETDAIAFDGGGSDYWPIRGARPGFALGFICPGPRRLGLVWSIRGMLDVYDDLQQERESQKRDVDVLLDMWRSRSTEDPGGETAWDRCLTELFQRHGRLVVTAAALSAEVYRIDHGKWPESLDKLGDEALLDPFSGKPLKYKQMDGDCIIYSVGMNQRDDGGEEGRDYGADDRKDDIVFRLFAVEKRNVRPKAAERKPDDREKPRRRPF